MKIFFYFLPFSALVGCLMLFSSCSNNPNKSVQQGVAQMAIKAGSAQILIVNADSNFVSVQDTMRRMFLLSEMLLMSSNMQNGDSTDFVNTRDSSYGLLTIVCPGHPYCPPGCNPSSQTCPQSTTFYNDLNPASFQFLGASLIDSAGNPVGIFNTSSNFPPEIKKLTLVAGQSEGNGKTYKVEIKRNNSQNSQIFMIPVR